MYNFMYGLFLFLIVLFAGSLFYMEYRVVSKHYKDMDFVDYVFSRHKLMITPDRGNS